MRNRDEKLEEIFDTILKVVEDAGVKVAHKERENIAKRTPENVRIRGEALVWCTKVIKRKVLKKQARKARAEHLVNCSV